VNCSLPGIDTTFNRGDTSCKAAIVGVAVGLGLDVAVAVGLGVSPGASVGVAVGAGLVAVAVGAGLVGVDLAAGPWVGVGVASSPQARMKRVNILPVLIEASWNTLGHAEPSSEKETAGNGRQHPPLL